MKKNNTRSRKGASGLSSALLPLLTALALLSGCASSEIRRDEPLPEPAQSSAVTPTDSMQDGGTPSAVTPVSSAQPAVTPAPAPEPEKEPEKPDPNIEVYANALPAKGLKLRQTKKKGIYQIKGLEGSPSIEYHDGILLTFDFPEENESDPEPADENGGDIPDLAEDTDGEASGGEELLAIEEPNLRIVSYDLEKGLILGESDTETTGYTYYSGETCGAVKGGFYSCRGDTVRFLDLGLNVTDSFKIPVVECSQLWVTSDRKYLICNDRRGPSRLYDIENRCEIELSKKVKAVTVTSYDGFSFDIINTKDKRFKVMTTGSVIPSGSVLMPNYYYSPSETGSCAVDVVPAGITVRQPDGGAAKLVDIDPEELSFIFRADLRYLTYQTNDGSTFVCDLENGRLSEPIKKASYTVTGKCQDGSFAYIDSSEWEKGMKYFIVRPGELEYTGEVSCQSFSVRNEEYKLYFRDTEPDSETSAELLDRLLKEYNVRVLFTPYKENTNYCGYYCKGYSGSQEEILRGILEFLQLSPPELLTECAKNGAETWFFISYDITDDPDLSSYGTAAFATTIGMHPFAALETPVNEEDTADFYADDPAERDRYFAEYITKNLSHEFIHLLDANTTDLQAEEWAALSPEDAYYNTYDQMDGDGTYDYIYFEKPYDNNVYFTDQYGRINALEDKARIGENLYYARTGDLYSPRTMFVHSRSLYNKARKLSEIFRANYPCLKQIPEGEWYLEKPLMGSYEEMKKAWKAEEKAMETGANGEYGYDGWDGE